MYLTPLNGLYFSPVMSSFDTLRPEVAKPEILNLHCKSQDEGRHGVGLG